MRWRRPPRADEPARHAGRERAATLPGRIGPARPAHPLRRRADAHRPRCHAPGRRAPGRLGRGRGRPGHGQLGRAQLLHAEGRTRPGALHDLPRRPPRDAARAADGHPPRRPRAHRRLRAAGHVPALRRRAPAGRHRRARAAPRGAQGASSRPRASSRRRASGPCRRSRGSIGICTSPVGRRAPRHPRRHRPPLAARARSS